MAVPALNPYGGDMGDGAEGGEGGRCSGGRGGKDDVSSRLLDFSTTLFLRRSCPPLSCRLVLPSFGLLSKAKDAVGGKCPDGSGEDPDEENDEQQCLPNVMAATLPRGGRR